MIVSTNGHGRPFVRRRSIAAFICFLVGSAFAGLPVFTFAQQNQRDRSAVDNPSVGTPRLQIQADGSGVVRGYLDGGSRFCSGVRMRLGAISGRNTLMG